MLFTTLMSDFMIFVTLTVTLLSLTLWYYKCIFKPYADFPSIRLEHRIPYWFLTRRQLNFAIFQTFVEQSKKHFSEGMFVAWAGQPILLVYGEDIVKNIVSEPAATDKATFYRVFEYFFLKSIFSSNGEKYKKQRRMVAPAFHTKALKSYTNVMNRYAEAMVKRLHTTESQPTKDVVDILTECTINILFETNLGELERNPEEIKEITKLVKNLTELFVKRIFCPWLYFDFSLYLFPSTRKVIRLFESVTDVMLRPKLENIKAYLISRRASPHKEETDLQFYGKKLKPFGESFLEQHLEDPTISIDDIIHQMTFVIGAGFDTVVHTMKFALFLLGLHQDVQERAREEVMAETEGFVSYEDQQSLIYLECVIKETLRLYAVPLFGRCVHKELQCGPYKIPKDSNVFVFSHMLHRNPEVFPNPEKFDPERFRDNNSNIKPWQYIPFAEGLRQCTGKNYAMIKMKIILSHVLRNFKIISLDRWEDVEIKWALILDCTKKLRMQFVPIGDPRQQNFVEPT